LNLYQKKIFSMNLFNLINKKSSNEMEIGSQNLSPYWNPEFAASLEVWGEGSVWTEIQLLIAGCSGKVLDIACGTGKVIEILQIFPKIDAFGCDISDFLIQKAIQRGISEKRLLVCNATEMSYPDNFFDYAYSIGSLEHFTEVGLEKCISECYRVTKRHSFHLVPVSRSGINEGWKTTDQSFYNNSITWWNEKFSLFYSDVIVLNSSWNDDLSVGKWFICCK